MDMIGELSRHQEYLDNHCRICGKRLGISKYCTKANSALVELFGIDSSSDIPLIHPRYYCNSCHLTAKRKRTQTSGITNRDLPEWLPHDENSCVVCDTLCKGGRPKKKKTGGRPSALQQHIQSVRCAYPQLSNITSTSSYTADYTCIFCKSFVTSPVEVQPCKGLACSKCCVSIVSSGTIGKNFVCPFCVSEHSLASSTFAKISPIAEKVLREILVKCVKCEQHVPLQVLDKDCTSSHTQSSHAERVVTLEDVIQQPLQAEPTHLEKQVALNLVSRMMHQQGDSTIVSLPRQGGGKPITLIKVPKPIVSSSECARNTKRRRSDQMAKIREQISLGSSKEQMVNELHVLPVEERAVLMKEADFTITVPPEQGLAMKSDLGLPWRKLRVMRRWMKSWGMNIASEAKQRNLMTTQLLNMKITGESIPFSFRMKNGDQELRPAPMAFVNDLKSMIFHLLEEKERLGQLTWHDGMIPPDEIWIKIGGDKGVLEAPDSSINLRIALKRYHDQISDLQRMEWKGHSIKIFMPGDYEFLCTMYGISGASGCHCCLWCTITSDSLKIPRASRQTAIVIPRSLDHLSQKYGEFLNDGGNLKKAKLYYNVIHETFFNIPLIQVCPPGLHITLGIFQRLFNLLEEECHQLDLQLKLQTLSSQISSSITFQQYHQARTTVTTLENERQSIILQNDQAHQVLVYLLLTIPDPMQNTRVQMVEELTKTNKKRISDIDTTIAKFYKDEGLFVKGLDNALSAIDIQRQAYFGGSFIGNHVHKVLQPKNIEFLCQTIIKVATDTDLSLLSKAQEVSDKFKLILGLFSKCHKIYDSSSLLSDDEITLLGSHIDDFVANYRSSFPNATFLPKMHMLEDHIVPWFKKWRVGCGLMGEQGAESLHANFNSTERAYSNMKDRVERLRVVLQNHHMQITPANISLEPPLIRTVKKKDTPGAETDEQS